MIPALDYLKDSISRQLLAGYPLEDIYQAVCTMEVSDQMRNELVAHIIQNKPKRIENDGIEYFTWTDDSNGSDGIKP